MSKISLIAAVAHNRVIGRNNQMPWYLPADFRYFKQITMGKPIVMGRKTWESLGRPLPGRKNIVLTRNADYKAEGATVVPNAAAAISLTENEPEIMIIGGGEIYQQFLPEAKRLYLTEVNADIEGDTLFPSFDRSKWKAISRLRHLADGKHAYPYTFTIFEHHRTA